MAKRPTINTLANTASPTYLTQLNQNFTNIRDQFDNTLSLDGSTPNAMNADIDLNGNDILNVSKVYADSLFINGTPVGEVSYNFETRAAFVVDNTSNPGLGLSDGQIVFAGGYEYRRLATSTAIPDLPGWEPNGEWTVRHFGVTGDGITNDSPAGQAALTASTAVMLVFPAGAYRFNTSVLGNWSQLVRYEAGVTFPATAPSRVTVFAEHNDQTYVTRIRRTILAPTTMQATHFQFVDAVGDNANFIGATGHYYVLTDHSSVDGTNRPCLVGATYSMRPRFARELIGIDDVAGVLVQNDTDQVGAKGTDAFYLGKNPFGAFPGDESEWVTGVTLGANLGYGFRTSQAAFCAFNASGRMRGSDIGTGFGFYADQEIRSSVTSDASVFRSQPSVQDAAFTLPNLRHFFAAQDTFGVSATVQNQYGFAVSPGLVGAQNNFGFYGNIPSGSGRWNFFANGTANNAFAGNVRVGSVVAPTCALDVTGGVRTSRTNVTAPAATDGNVFSGTYTPTLTNQLNIASSSAGVCQYMRVGNVVTVSGRVTITPTAVGTVELLISLPIAAPSLIADECRGTSGLQSSIAAEIQSGGGHVAGDSATRTAILRAAPTVNALRNHSFSFTYLVE